MRQIVSSTEDQIPISLLCSSFLALWLHKQDWTLVLCRIRALGISFRIWEQCFSEITMALVEGEKSEKEWVCDSGYTKQQRKNPEWPFGGKDPRKSDVCWCEQKKRDKICSQKYQSAYLLPVTLSKKSPTKKPQTITTCVNKHSKYPGSVKSRSSRKKCFIFPFLFQ